MAAISPSSAARSAPVEPDGRDVAPAPAPTTRVEDDSPNFNVDQRAAVEAELALHRPAAATNLRVAAAAAGIEIVPFDDSLADLELKAGEILLTWPDGGLSVIERDHAGEWQLRDPEGSALTEGYGPAALGEALKHQKKQADAGGYRHTIMIVPDAYGGEMETPRRPDPLEAARRDFVEEVTRRFPWGQLTSDELDAAAKEFALANSDGSEHHSRYVESELANAAVRSGRFRIVYPD